MISQASSPITLTEPEQIQPRNMSDLIVDYLEQLGVEYVFGIPGGHNSAFYEALARSERRGGVRAVLTCHETGAAFMADGYARETGKIGVCCGTTGPGSTNFITGLASAYAEGIPLLVITAQTALPNFSWSAFQESSPDTIDTVAMFKHCTRYNSLVTHPNQLERKLAAALTTVLHSPFGPAHLSIPVNIFRVESPSSLAYPQVATQAAALVDLKALDELDSTINNILDQGQTIAIWVGQDCRKATPEIMALAELINASIVTTQGGKTCVNPYHPLVKGVFGFAGHQTARQALTDDSVALILAAGMNLGQWETSAWDQKLLTKKIVHIHHARDYFKSSPMASLHIQGTIKTTLAELLKRLQKTRQRGQLKPELSASLSPEFYQPYQPAHITVKEPDSYRLSEDNSPVKPQQLIGELLQHFPPETRYLVDVGNWLAWTIHYFFPPRPENFRLAVATAPMGWGIGSAIGTAMGAKNTPVVCLTGDGCFLMHGNELAVAVAEKLPIIFIILNDQSFGMVKHRHLQTGVEPLEFALPSVDFSQIARGMGANGYIIRNSQDLQELDYEAIYRDGKPTVLDVRIDSEYVPPIGMF
ncbi:MAG: thiamine pyrophosphate-binding protein [Microcystis sp. LE19-10.1B]|uniref:thiamine pyrophosphate-binding protein n=1 Tax=Microcystis sp. LE19-10.1B TaxID=3016428 RepID=UPI0022C12E06|nr:thiamine pyrophosphate-binding protein [Microcystis sp. LE19-10.1B]MCZ8025283.1 thiamine pyrophosphate-binding protein [Microcystis sp. LE19-10.1B]MCZ8362953.1 thiamine pyrophosphate-binding protein [Microcystis sp. LE19-251.1A]